MLTIDTYDIARSVLRNNRDFLQWDGYFQGSAGKPVFAGDVTGGPALCPIPSLSRRIESVGHGPFCHAQTAIFLDPPEHTRFRRALAEDWDIDAAARELSPPVRERAAGLIAAARTEDCFDFMRAVAAPLSATSLAWFFGDSPDPWLKLTLEHPDVWGAADSGDRGVDVLRVFQEHLWDLITRRVRSPAPGALSRMVQHSLRGGGLSLPEIQTLVLQMSVVANESVIRLLGTVAAVLGLHPEVRARLRQDPASVGRLVDEALRACPPIRGVFRRTRTACSAGPLPVDAGRGLFVDLKLAGRDQDDPAQDPLAGIDLDEAAAHRHLAFGFGAHYCAGARLAVMQAVVMAGILCDGPDLQIPGHGLERVPQGPMEGPSRLLLEASGR